MRALLTSSMRSPCETGAKLPSRRAAPNPIQSRRKAEPSGSNSYCDPTTPVRVAGRVTAKPVRGSGGGPSQAPALRQRRIH